MKKGETVNPVQSHSVVEHVDTKKYTLDFIEKLKSSDITENTVFSINGRTTTIGKEFTNMGAFYKAVSAQGVTDKRILAITNMVMKDEPVVRYMQAEADRQLISRFGIPNSKGVYELNEDGTIKTNITLQDLPPAMVNDNNIRILSVARNSEGGYATTEVDGKLQLKYDIQDEISLDGKTEQEQQMILEYAYKAQMLMSKEDAIDDFATAYSYTETKTKYMNNLQAYARYKHDLENSVNPITTSVVVPTTVKVDGLTTEKSYL